MGRFRRAQAPVPPEKAIDKQAIIDDTRRWISSVVIGLNLCPFARRVFEADLIRYVVVDAEDEVALREDLAGELKTLASTAIARVETTLLIHPHVLADFLDYNDFLGIGEKLIGDLGLRGIIQLVSFHPHYQFAGSDPCAVENYTNRSPYAMLHLLREASVTAVASDTAAMREIPRRNAEVLRVLGREKILARLRGTDEGRG